MATITVTYESLAEVASLVSTLWSKYYFVLEEHSGALCIPVLKFILGERPLEREHLLVYHSTSSMDK